MGQGSGVAVSCCVGHRHGSDLALLWLWGRPAATAPIRPLAWEPPYAMGAALRRQKTKDKKKKKKKREREKDNQLLLAQKYDKTLAKIHLFKIVGLKIFYLRL